MISFRSSFLHIIFLLIAGFAGFAGQAAADPLSESLIYHTYFGTGVDVQRLLDKGANPNSKDEHGWTALAIATDRNDKQALTIATALVKKGADINAAVGRNYPLINAISNKNAGIVALLMAHDVSLRVMDDKGNSALGLAKKLQQPDIIYYIEKRMLEEAQLKTFLISPLHQWQIARRYVKENCAFQYWAFYLKSEQDKKMDVKALKKRVSAHAAKAQAEAVFGSRYSQAFQGTKPEALATSSRQMIFDQLNGMISNRNRREMGVGTEADYEKRCNAVVSHMKQSGSDIVIQ